MQRKRIPTKRGVHREIQQHPLLYPNKCYTQNFHCLHCFPGSVCLLTVVDSMMVMKKMDLGMKWILLTQMKPRSLDASGMILPKQNQEQEELKGLMFRWLTSLNRNLRQGLITEGMNVCWKKGKWMEGMNVMHFTVNWMETKIYQMWCIKLLPQQ